MMVIRRARKEDINSITEIHLDAYKGFFLSSLGRHFLKKYYTFGLKANGSIFLCAITDEDKIAGFCFGAERSKGFHKRLIGNNILSFSFLGLRLFFTRPKAIIRLIFNLEKKTAENDDGDYAELLSIAVSNGSSCKGFGKRLLGAFENEAKTLQCEGIALTTDVLNNELVIAFYKNSGYRSFYEFTTFPNRRMLKLIKDI